jgi:hypothetical protein
MNGNVCGDRAVFPTPGHSKTDRGSWASIVPGAPDGVLVHSENGGDPLAIKDILRLKGAIGQREPFRPSGTNSSKPRQAAVTYFEFKDAEGVTVCRKVRTDRPDGSKNFAWQHIDESGAWAPGRGRSRLFYRLTDLLACSAHSRHSA